MTPYAWLGAAHVLAALVWVGGMFFSWMILRPEAARSLEAPERLSLWLGVFKRFFNWVWACVIILPITGIGMLHLGMNGFANMPRYIQLMAGLFLVMFALFLRIQLLLLPVLRSAVAMQDWPAGADALAKMRRLVGINLLVGLSVVAIATLRVTF